MTEYDKGYKITVLCAGGEKIQQETARERLLENASRKFLSSGYQKASPRTTCRDAGVTAGALYFFFKDKSTLLHTLVRDTAEAVVRVLYQHASFEEEVYSNTDQFMDMKYDIRFAQELISFCCAHGTALGLLFNCSWGSTYQGLTGQIIAYLVKQNTKIISTMVKDDDTVFNAYTLHWLSQIQVEAFLHILSHHYSQEQALRQIHTVVAFLRGGFEGLYQQAVRNQIRGILPFSFTA